MGAEGLGQRAWARGYGRMCGHMDIRMDGQTNIPCSRKLLIPEVSSDSMAMQGAYSVKSPDTNFSVTANKQMVWVWDLVTPQLQREILAESFDPI